MTHPGELLSALLDGELSDEDQTRVADHLASCTVCGDELRDLHAARAAVRSLPVLEMPPALRRAAPDREAVPLTRRPPVLVAAAAAAILALFVGIATILAPPTTLEVRLDQLSDQYGARTSLEPAITPHTPVPARDRIPGPIE